MVQSLEYLDDPQPALLEVWRVLRPGGRLILSGPYHESFWRLWEQGLYLPTGRPWQSSSRPERRAGSCIDFTRYAGTVA